MKEKSYQGGVAWRDISQTFKTIIGQIITDIVLFSFTESFYDSVSSGDGARPDGGDYFDSLVLVLSNGGILEISGQTEYMWVCELDYANIKLFPTHSEVYIKNEVDNPPVSPYMSFVPFNNGYKTGLDALCLSEDNMDTLHWAIRYIFPYFDDYTDEFPVSVADWERIMVNWQFIFEASYDEVYERFCGIDYGLAKVTNFDLMHHMNHTGRLWKNSDSAWEIYSDFRKWFNYVKKECTHIVVYGY